MIKGLLKRLTAPRPRLPTFPARDTVALFEQRALRVNNRDRAAAAVMVRKLVILSEGRKS